VRREADLAGPFDINIHTGGDQTEPAGERKLEQTLLRRIWTYAKLLVGRGWDTVAFLVATVYSIYAFFVPVETQKHVLRLLHIDPSQRLAVWAFGLAGFFLYAGFRAWNESEKARPSGLGTRTLSRLAELLTKGEEILAHGRTTKLEHIHIWDMSYNRWKYECESLIESDIGVDEAAVFSERFEGMVIELYPQMYDNVLDGIGRDHNRILNALVSDVSKLKTLLQRWS
jgi:hypothetical protein